MTKICTKCKERKLKSEFNKCAAKPDGLKQQCRVCSNKSSIEYNEMHKDHLAKLSKLWHMENNWKYIEARSIARLNNPEYYRELDRQYYKANPERGRQKQANWKKAHPEYQANYTKENIGKLNARTAKRRAKKLQATQNWGEFNNFIIEEAYNLSTMRSNLTNIKWEVDHIIPLQSKYVCGLHVGINLQVIPAIDNRKKSNKLPSEFL